MSADELEAMADRATTEDATVQAEVAEATEPETPQPAAVDLEQLTGILGFMIKGVGNIICDRAGVTLLGDDEAAPIAGAAIQVLCLYDLNVNPRLAAWCTLAVVVAPPILLRVEERREAVKARQEASHEPPEEPTTPATAYGEGENVTPAATRPKSKARRGRPKKT